LLLFAQPIQNTDPAGGGEFIYDYGGDNCLSDNDRCVIQDKLRENIDILTAAGKLPKPVEKAIVNFEWPLQKNSGLTFNNCFAISGFVDQNQTSGTLDYNCDARTYDGHTGTDVYTWPFPWYLVENDYAEVIAGADGVIIGKSDGFDDDHCFCIGTWNAVYVQHSDGSIAWYGHMKKNSLTSKLVGETVTQGEFLGVVASSGCSTGPHLHFEVHDSTGNVIDPYTGVCNSLNSTTWWASQPGYREPTVNAVLTHDAEPIHGCPGINETPNMQNTFGPGDLIYFATYYRDQLNSDLSTYRIRRPDGSVWNEWPHTSPTTYNSSWWYWTNTLPTFGPFGTWSFEVEYNGQTIAHDFLYTSGASIEENVQSQNITIVPNPSSSDEIHIMIDNLEPAEIEIIDFNGKLVKKIRSESGKINVRKLSPGIYTLIIRTEKSLCNERFIIQ
jgi:murein DD-endopeptidase MepM/ murein hydrolase activator NlpD